MVSAWESVAGRGRFHPWIYLCWCLPCTIHDRTDERERGKLWRTTTSQGKCCQPESLLAINHPHKSRHKIPVFVFRFDFVWLELRHKRCFRRWSLVPTPPQTRNDCECDGPDQTMQTHTRRLFRLPFRLYISYMLCIIHVIIYSRYLHI